MAASMSGLHFQKETFVDALGGHFATSKIIEFWQAWLWNALPRLRIHLACHAWPALFFSSFLLCRTACMIGLDTLKLFYPDLKTSLFLYS